MAKRNRIFVVDDDPIVLEATQALLEAEGYEVTTHRGAFGASAQIYKMRPELVLLDSSMAGLSGEDLARILSTYEWMEGTRVYFHSYSPEAELEAAVLETEADGYVRKGNRTELLVKIAAALAGRGRGGST